MQFSLRWLLGGVAFIAIACVSLRYASDLLCTVLAASLFAFLMTAVLGALYASRERRRFWAGCAIVGWAYILRATDKTGSSFEKSAFHSRFLTHGAPASRFCHPL
ncbi:MAG TPA: hypothetical protein VHC22_34045 [Pirellulales bacterium]|nr:hypothetical protein [Pirellulales bacterium]